MKQSTQFLKMKMNFLLPITIVIGFSIPVALNAQTNTFPSTGNAGIGTLSPQAPLHVNHTAPRILMFDNDIAISTSNPAWSVRSQQDGYFKVQTTTDYVNYTDRFVISSAGNFGIGTSTPASIFSVVGSSVSSTAHSSFGSTQWRMKINSGDEANSGTIDYRGFDPNALGIVGAGTGANRLIRMWEFVGINSSPSTSQALNVSGSGATYAAIFQNGKVGIGTTTPVKTLHVVGSEVGSHTAEFTNTTGYGIVAGAVTSATYGSIQAIGGGGAADLGLQAVLGGKVGIGTTTPAEQLHVWGTSGANGVIKISSNNGFTNNFLRVVDGVGNGLQIQRGDQTTIMAFDNTNLKVGIGTTAPIYQLHLKRDENTGTGSGILVENINTGNNAAAFIKFRNGNGASSEGTLAVSAAGQPPYGAITGANNLLLYTANAAGIALMTDVAGGSIRFAAGGNVESMRINNNGNVGIGTTEPGAKLDVVGNIKSSNEIQAQIIRASKKVNIGTATLVLENDPGGLVNSIYTDAGSPSTDLLIQSNPAFNHNTLINANNTGNVGIGINIPTAKLHIGGTPGVDGIKFPDGTSQTTAYTGTNAAGWLLNGNAGTNTLNDFIGTTDAKDLVFKTNGEERMRIHEGGDHPGNVGIGTDDPEKKLHVLTKHTTCALCPPGTHEGIRLEEQTTYTDLPGNPTDISVWDLQPLGLGFAIKNPTGTPKFFISSTGNVGIGTSGPTAKLHIGGTPGVDGIKFPDGTLQTTASQSTQWGTSGNDIYYNTSGGKVFIGTTPSSTTGTTYELNVCGTILSKEVIVQTGWCDFVFADNYKLMSLDERAAFIKSNKHLPHFPSAAQVESAGANVGASITGLLQNTEELTLYLIELDKKVSALEKENTLLKSQIKSLVKK